MEKGRTASTKEFGGIVIDLPLVMGIQRVHLFITFQFLLLFNKTLPLSHWVLNINNHCAGGAGGAGASLI